MFNSYVSLPEGTRFGANAIKPQHTWDESTVPGSDLPGRQRRRYGGLEQYREHRRRPGCDLGMG